MNVDLEPLLLAAVNDLLDVRHPDRGLPLAHRLQFAHAGLEPEIAVDALLERRRRARLGLRSARRRGPAVVSTDREGWDRFVTSLGY